MTRFQILTISFAFIVVFFSCTNSTEQQETKIESTNEVSNAYVQGIEKAHNKKEFDQQSAIQFDLLLTFGDQERINGRLTLLTNSSKGLMEMKDGSRILFDGSKVYSNLENSKKEKIRFDAFTWSYFFLFPYKLSDEGTRWSDFSSDSLNGNAYLTEKLSFESGTGDAPDDWYIVYADPSTNLIHAAAYIVTVNKSIDKAEEDPHAIVYEDYVDVDGVPIASTWAFRGWRAEQGLTDTLGHAQLSNIQFIQPDKDFFIPKTDDLLQK